MMMPRAAAAVTVIGLLCLSAAGESGGADAPLAACRQQLEAACPVPDGCGGRQFLCAKAAQRACHVCAGADANGIPMKPPTACIARPTRPVLVAFCAGAPPPAPPAPPPGPAGPINASSAEVDLMRSTYESVLAAQLENPGRSTCSHDMRAGFPPCHQLGTMWCWATAVAAATEYYTSQGAARCVGLECEIVGWTFSDDYSTCCPAETYKDTCGDRGAGWDKVQKALNHFTKKTWERPNGPLDKATLDATLQAGNPVIMMVGPATHPNHVVTVHGCSPSGKYWFHDPEFISDPTDPKHKNYEEWFEVDFDWLLEMCYVWVHDDSQTDPRARPWTDASGAVHQHSGASLATSPLTQQWHAQHEACNGWSTKPACGGMCTGQKLIQCTRGSPKADDEIFRIKSIWWDTLYIPVPPSAL